ncbi:MAG TPA: sigma factor-like helix-turn-helix DNA-binding protein, partial [Holophagaceae bacterium]|nr:sigma factor-like helix-turn-helix DNA-binding protein [Holophagaceae bacterium]
HEAFHDQMEKSLASISEKERRILELHFGLHGTEPMTLEQIGRSFLPPISRERVRQLEERAFAKIRDRRRGELEGFLHGELS